MNYDWNIDLKPRSGMAAATLPPAFIEEAAWDILLALHSDEECNLNLDKLASIVSVPKPALNQWLGLLEQRQLITGEIAPDLRAVLTAAGRELLDRYLSAANSLQVGTHH